MKTSNEQSCSEKAILKEASLTLVALIIEKSLRAHF